MRHATVMGFFGRCTSLRPPWGATPLLSHREGDSVQPHAHAARLGRWLIRVDEHRFDVIAFLQVQLANRVSDALEAAARVGQPTDFRGPFLCLARRAPLNLMRHGSRCVRQPPIIDNAGPQAHRIDPCELRPERRESRPNRAQYRVKSHRPGADGGLQRPHSLKERPAR